MRIDFYKGDGSLKRDGLSPNIRSGGKQEVKGHVELASIISFHSRFIYRINGHTELVAVVWVHTM